MTRSAKHTNGIYALMLVGYFVLYMLIAQQGRTIDSQGRLIRTLFADSLELNKIKMHQAAARHPKSKPAAAVKAD